MTMTTLNKEIRRKIIDSVIEKGTTIPKRKEELARATEARVRALCLERVPKEFPAATKNLPPEWFPLIASENIKANANPVCVATWSDEQLRSGHWGIPVSFEPFRHPINTRFSRSDFIDQGMDYTDRTNPVRNPADMESWEAKLADLLKKAHKIREDEKRARDELRLFLYSVKTYKQIVEKMPELEKHLPDYEKPMPLTVPVAPILKTLSALGFDQSAG
jgi:hypothetical protein